MQHGGSTTWDEKPATDWRNLTTANDPIADIARLRQ
jgi:hypothetical protein